MRMRTTKLALSLAGLAMATPALPLHAQAGVPSSLYAGMRWRLVGPYRAGWATVATGVPGKPNTFYFGAAGGGVWRTDDAGRTWRPLMQHESAASVGALAVASSDASVLYVGTGQVAARYDVLEGDGVYRSADGGETWRNTGLRESRHIGRILVDPHDPDRVLVAALGPYFAASRDRGVYLTTDGGARWTRVLAPENDRTGAVDLARDDAHPGVVYAATWQTQMHPWLDYFQPRIGPGSGIWKSTDGGAHWSRLSGGGLPPGPLGRIGIAVSGDVVYASIVASGDASGLYRSGDGGAHWTRVNADAALASDYFGRVTVAPDDPNTVYVMGQSIRRSTDGGRTITIVKGAPGGDDYHFLWIDPADPSHMVTGADQGAAVTVDGGRMWSSWYNQPTGQFYHVAADDRFPYRIYSGQQDNGTVGILSRGPYGVIELRDWHPVGGDERDYMVPKPGAPDTVFGSGLGGHLSRFDETTRQVAEASPWPVSTYGARPTTVKYRYTWITPLEFSPLPPHPMFFGAQVLFRSDDDGDTWRTISPDLTGAAPGGGRGAAAPPSDPAVAKADARESRRAAPPCQDPSPAEAVRCGFGVIYTIAPSPLQADEIWVGTDDGLIQLTRDGGAHWTNVTPPAVPAWGRIDAISPSRFTDGTAYAVVDMHRIGNDAPLVLRTGDFGKTWTRITDRIHADDYVMTVRADPVKPGLLYAGTRRRVYVSFDDGAHWQSLALNLPTVQVRDLLVHDGDLIAATNGRGLWVLDDVSPLRQAGADVAAAPAYLFRPDTAIRLRADENRDTPWPPSTPLGENPPTGAVIDYWLADSTSGAVTLAVKDAAGALVRRFSSDEPPPELPAERYFTKDWLGAPQRLSTAAGMHRYVWDLRGPRPPALHYEHSIAAVWPEHTPLLPEGALVLPGRYTVTLEAAGSTLTQPLTVTLDPRVHPPAGALESQLALADSIAASLRAAAAADSAIGALLQQKKATAGPDVAGRFADLRSGTGGLQEIDGVLASLFTAVESADAAPTRGQRAVYHDYGEKLEAVKARWKELRSR